jgi:C4-dicarboxylate transporter DctQ subunit
MVSVMVVVISVLLRPLEIASPWADESACLFFIWTVFLSAAIGLKRNVHIRIDILLIRIPQRVREVLLFVLNLLCLAFCGGVLSGVYQMMRAVMVMHSPALELSMVYFYLPLLIGFAMMILYLVMFTLNFIFERIGNR